MRYQGQDTGMRKGLWGEVLLPDLPGAGLEGGAQGMKAMKETIQTFVRWDEERKIKVRTIVNEGRGPFMWR